MQCMLWSEFQMQPEGCNTVLHISRIPTQKTCFPQASSWTLSDLHQSEICNKKDRWDSGKPRRQQTTLI